MHFKEVLFVLVTTLIFIFLSSNIIGTTYQCNSVSTCNTTILSAASGDIIQLNTSLANITTTAINFFGKDNLTFDCLGNSITGNSTANTYGVFFNNSNGGSNNNILRNCYIYNFTYGIYLLASNNNTLYNLVTTNNRLDGSSTNQYGVYIWQATNSTFYNITSSGNSNAGFYTTSSLTYGNNISNITADSNGYGVYFISSTRNHTLSNAIIRYSNYGVIISFSSNNITIDNLTYIANSSTPFIKRGVYLDTNAQNNTIRNSNFNSTSLDINALGIVVNDDSNNNTIYNNNFRNLKYGIYVSNSMENKIHHNNFTGNKGSLEVYSSQIPPLPYFNNSINTSNLIDGLYPIYYNFSAYNYTYDGKITSNVGSIICANCTNITIRNFVFDHNNTGVFFFNTSNSSVYNITSRGNIFGIYSYSGYYNNFSNLTLLSNDYGLYYVIDSQYCSVSNINADSNDYGLYLYSNLINNTFSDINVTRNRIKGIYVYASVTNNNFSRITANYNNDSIHLESNSNYNSFTNISAQFNNYSGIYLSSSSENNNFTNITSSSNMNGFDIDSSYNNTIKNSKIENNSQYGLYFLESSWFVPPIDNWIYNNIINNSINYYNLTGVSDIINNFNTTLSSGTNIAGGNILGGNFWAHPNGTGFSETCTDSNLNGICDATYQLDYLNFDYLPLTYFTQSSNSVSNSSSSSSGGGGGGGDSSNKVSNVFAAYVKAGTPTEIKTPETSNTEIIGIVLTTKIDVFNVIIKFTEVEKYPAEISIGDGLAYEAFQMNISNVNDSNIENVSISFKVNRTWVNENNINYSEIKLYRNNEESWNPLTTTLKTTDSENYYFTALSPGFSDYVIFAKVIEEEVVINDELYDGSLEGLNLGIGSVLIYYLIVSALSIGIVFVSYSLIRKLKEKKRKKLPISHYQ